MLNLLDSNFWVDGQKLQNFSSKSVKIKNLFQELGSPKIRREELPSVKRLTDDQGNEFHESEIIRIAVDLRFAENFKQLWA
jgi:hypothetical protein